MIIRNSLANLDVYIKMQNVNLNLTYHILLEQEQGLSTQLSSLSVSSDIRSPQW